MRQKWYHWTYRSFHSSIALHLTIVVGNKNFLEWKMKKKNKSNRGDNYLCKWRHKQTSVQERCSNPVQMEMDTHKFAIWKIVRQWYSCIDGVELDWNGKNKNWQQKKKKRSALTMQPQWMQTRYVSNFPFFFKHSKLSLSPCSPRFSLYWHTPPFKTHGLLFSPFSLPTCSSFITVLWHFHCIRLILQVAMQSIINRATNDEEFRTNQWQSFRISFSSSWLKIEVFLFCSYYCCCIVYHFAATFKIIYFI